jgi:PhnB protein
MQIHPYLFFDGCCEEAIEFYKAALGGEVDMLMRYRESPEPPCPDEVRPDIGDKIMHASLRIGDAMIMASDDCTPAPKPHGGYSLSLSVPDVAAAERTFAALGAGGSVQMPLGRTFWSPCFGMLTDRFGVGWMLNVAPSSPA